MIPQVTPLHLQELLASLIIAVMTLAKCELRLCMTVIWPYAGAGSSIQHEADENVDHANRPADVHLDSPSRVGSSQAKWNTQPEAATALAAADDESKSTKVVDSSQSKQTKKSTRSQPVRKRKG